MQVLAAERRKYWGSESPSRRGGPGVATREIVGQNPVFWFVLGKKT